MTFTPTKTASAIFDPVDSGGNARGAVMAEARTWGTEVEQELDSLDGRLTSVETGVGSGPVNPNAADARASSAFSLFRRIVAQGVSNARIIFLGDSTGNATDEFIYLFAQWLGTREPTHGVLYYAWDEGAGAYASPVSVSSGTLPLVIQVYNAAIPGINLIGWLGSRFAGAVGAVTPHAIVINTGLNVAGLENQEQQRKSFIDGIQTIMTARRFVPISMHLQQPLRDNDRMAMVNDAQRDVAAMMPGVALIDSYSKFIAANKPSAWYADDTHTNSAGTQVLLQSFKDAYNASGNLLPAPQELTPWFDTIRRVSLLKNGDFAAFSGALPDNWTEGGTGTVTKDTVLKYGTKPWSVRIPSTNLKFIRQILDTDQLNRVKGRVVSFAARVYVAPGGPAYAGTIYVVPTGGTFSAGVKETFRFNPGDGAGGWREIYIDNFYVPIDTTQLDIRIYASGDTTAATLNVDELHMYFGAGRPEALIR